MARVFMTGFEDGTVNAFSVTTGSTVASTTQKRTGSYSWNITGTSQKGIVSLATPVSELYVRLGCYPTGQVGAYYTPGNIIAFADASLGGQVRLTYNKNTTMISLYRGANTLLVHSSSTTPLNLWTCIECYVLISSSSGRFILKCNGLTYIDYTGNTQGGTGSNIYNVMFGTFSDGGTDGTMTGYLDDIAVNDTSGSVNNSWIGGGGIRLMPVNGAGAHTALTPSAGSNYQCVDEVPPSDADYVSTTVSKDSDANQYDLYTLSNTALPASGVVSAACLFVRSQITDGIASLVPLVRSNDTLVELPRRYLPQGYSRSDSIMNTDPTDSSALTLSKLAAMQVGVAKGDIT